MAFGPVLVSKLGALRARSGNGGSRWSAKLPVMRSSQQKALSEQSSRRGKINREEVWNMKVISDTAHGALDYVTVGLFAIAPTFLGLSGSAALISYALAVIHLTMTAFTDMPLGLVKIIPFKLHSLVEMVVGPVLVIGSLALPSLFKGGQAFFFIAGATIFAVWLLSSYGVERARAA